MTGRPGTEQYNDSTGMTACSGDDDDGDDDDREDRKKASSPKPPITKYRLPAS